jgi:hypothetical protein
MSRWSVGAVRPTRPSPTALALGLGSLWLLWLLAGCSDEGLPRCVTVDAACTPRYQPTFANVYANTLRDSCGSQSGVCHSATGRRGGLSMESADVAYTQLTAEGTDRVVAGDPACSEIVVRIHGTAEGYLMPPGAPLLAPDRCAIEQWIAAGAAFAPALSSSGAPSP